MHILCAWVSDGCRVLRALQRSFLYRLPTLTQVSWSPLFYAYGNNRQVTGQLYGAATWCSSQYTHDKKGVIQYIAVFSQTKCESVRSNMTQHNKFTVTYFHLLFGLQSWQASCHWGTLVMADSNNAMYRWEIELLNYHCIYTLITLYLRMITIYTSLMHIHSIVTTAKMTTHLVEEESLIPLFKGLCLLGVPLWGCVLAAVLVSLIGLFKSLVLTMP